ncbi:MAG: type II toxin-antitoxin system HicB family antitoxin [Parachlamydiales bacterium]
MMEYKGYTGKAEYDDKARIFHGEVIGLKDVITFQGTSVDELERAFRESVDDYLDWCRELGQSPEKPYSGKFLLRVDPSLHQQAALEAHMKGMSLNEYVTIALAQQLSKNGHFPPRSR